MELMQHVIGRGRRTDRHHPAHLFDVPPCGEHGGAAEAVADQQLWRAMLRAQPVGGGHQVLHIGRKIGVAELALAAAEPGEIEAQHAEAARHQRAGDPRRCQRILAAGEAVREQHEGAGDRVRQRQGSGQGRTAATRKLDALLRWHGQSPPRVWGTKLPRAGRVRQPLITGRALAVRARHAVLAGAVAAGLSQPLSEPRRTGESQSQRNHSNGQDRSRKPRPFGIRASDL
jgi:hypothetical protein